jgi:hypothetical protein
MMIVRGRRHPEFNGISVPISDLRQYNIALLVMDRGAFVFPTTSKPVPLKSNTAFLYFLFIVNDSVMGVPSSIYSVFVNVSISFKLFYNENLKRRFLTDSEALSHMNST